MDSLNLENPPVTITPAERKPRIWKFWGTVLWGLFVFAAMFVGQLAVVGWFILRQGWPNRHSGRDPGAWWRAHDRLVRHHGTAGRRRRDLAFPFTSRARRFRIISRCAGTSWSNLAIGIVAMIAVVMAWDMISRLTGREVQPGFMGDVVKSAENDGALWLLVIALCVAAPITEEFFRARFSLSRLVGIVPEAARRHPAVVVGVDVPSICNTIGSSSVRCSRSASCSAICATAASRSG